LSNHDEFNELKQYVGFSDDDARLLAQFAPACEPYVEEIVSRFYARVMECPTTRAVLTSEKMAARLRDTLRVWVRELLRGPWDQEYFERRCKIGHVHVRVGLDVQHMCTAMSVISECLVQIASKELKPAQFYPAVSAIQRVCAMDLAIMCQTYVARRESQQLGRLQELIFMHMPMVVFLVDRDNHILASTRAGETMLAQGKLHGAPLGQALHKGLLLRSQLIDLLALARETRETQVNPRIDWASSSGTRAYRCAVIPIDGTLDGTDENGGALVHIEDLTQTIRMEARIHQKDALERLGAMSASVAHELRNPLAGISGAVQVISSTMDPQDSRRQRMEQISQQIRRLDALVGDLLAFGRPPSYRPRPIALSEVNAHVVQIVSMENPGIDFETSGTGRATTDRDLVIQVLLNLLQNACQAIGTAGWIRLSCGDGWLEVCDSGPGIPDATRSRIFQPFFTTRVRGTGLGLAICQRAVETMGGQLMLMPAAPDEGARFRLEFSSDGDPEA